MSLNKNTIEKLRKSLKSIKQAVIVAHHNPDGDAVGSALALYHYLTKKGITPHIIFPNNFPDFLGWMFRGEAYTVYNEKNANTTAQLIAQTDAIFCVDFNVFHRTFFLEQYLAESEAYKVLIDHHLEPDNESFDLVFSTPETSATASLLFDIIDAMGDVHLVDKTMAECIYVAIATDTGSFSYNANYTRTYEILTHLFRLGIDGAEIQRLVYNNFTEKRMRLFGLCLNQNLFVEKAHKTAYIVLSLNDLKKYSYQVGDTEGIVNYAMAIKGIDMAVLFIERKNLIRISLRSYGNLSVNKLAADIFNGGGHKNAAGANSYEPLDKTIEKFLNVLKDLDKYIEDK